MKTLFLNVQFLIMKKVVVVVFGYNLKRTFHFIIEQTF